MQQVPLKGQEAPLTERKAGVCQQHSKILIFLLEDASLKRQNSQI